MERLHRSPVHRLRRACPVQGLRSGQGCHRRTVGNLIWCSHHLIVLGQRRTDQPDSTRLHRPVHHRRDSLQHSQGQWRSPQPLQPCHRLCPARCGAVRQQFLATRPLYATHTRPRHHALAWLLGGRLRPGADGHENQRWPENPTTEKLRNADRR